MKLYTVFVLPNRIDERSGVVMTSIIDVFAFCGVTVGINPDIRATRMRRFECFPEISRYSLHIAESNSRLPRGLSVNRPRLPSSVSGRNGERYLAARSESRSAMI
jgi:hypothetical protein